MYVAIFLALMVCTFLTYFVWTFHMPNHMLAFSVAIAIAIFKATLVIRYFMHIKWSNTLSKMSVVTAIVFLCILLILLSMDYTSRGWQPRPPGWETHQVVRP
jgi:cytochrome c oxidase subunit 4